MNVLLFVLLHHPLPVSYCYSCLPQNPVVIAAGLSVRVPFSYEVPYSSYANFAHHWVTHPR